MSDLQSEVLQSNVSTSDVTAAETSCVLGDVTSNSFSWPGGEVEITGSSVCEEKSIILPSDQAVKSLFETEETVISGSMIIQACDDHMDHDYHSPRMDDASLVEADAGGHHEKSNSAPPSGALDETAANEDFQQDVCGESSVTWKSFACDGGEVEISDVTRLRDETVPLLEEQFVECFQDISINSASLSVFGLQCQVEHADHPYCNTESDVCVVATLSETTGGSEEPADGPSDVTFRNLNCTGGEIEISDRTDLTDETVPLPCDQAAACSVSVSDGGDTSLFAGDLDMPHSGTRADHLYCYIDESLRSDELRPSPEPAPSSLGPEDELKEVSSVGSEDQASRQEDVAGCGSSLSGRVDADESEETPAAHTASPSVSSVAAAETQCHSPDDEKTSSYLENEADVETPSLSPSPLPDTCLKPQDQLPHTPAKDSTHPEDSALPSLATSASPTSAEEHLDHVSPERLSEARDSALGSSANRAALCGSVEKPRAGRMSDVLGVLSECPSVASALQFFSPAVRRASQSLFRALKNPAEDLFLPGDVALEDEKCLVIPEAGDPSRFWLEDLESPMSRPLLNSTALGGQAQPSPACEPAEDVEVKAGAAPQSEGDRAALNVPLIPEGPLQQQLRQMAEFLLLASGKLGPGGAPAPASTAPAAADAPAQSHSVCVGTSPLKWANHSINTSGVFELKREFSVTDSSTLTDPLLWK